MTEKERQECLLCRHLRVSCKGRVWRCKVMGPKGAYRFVKTVRLYEHCRFEANTEVSIER